MELLLNHKDIKINAVNQLGRTALHLAAYFGHYEVVQLLLAQNNIDVNLKDNKHDTALHIAARSSDHSKCIEILLNHKDVKINETSNFSKTALHYAAQHVFVQSTKLLLAHKDINVNLRDARGNTPLHLAGKNIRRVHSFGIFNLMLNRDDVEINATNKHLHTSLHYSALLGFFTSIKCLIAKKEINVDLEDVSGNTPLHLAAAARVYDKNLPHKQKRYYKCMELLLNHRGVKINTTNKCKMTALHYAAQYGFQEGVRLLLAQEGIDVNCEDKDGDSPLDLATMMRQEECIKLLRSHKNINVKQERIYGDNLDYKQDSLMPFSRNLLGHLVLVESENDFEIENELRN